MSVRLRYRHKEIRMMAIVVFLYAALQTIQYLADNALFSQQYITMVACLTIRSFMRISYDLKCTSGTYKLCVVNPVCLCVFFHEYMNNITQCDY